MPARNAQYAFNYSANLSFANSCRECQCLCGFRDTGNGDRPAVVDINIHTIEPDCIFFQDHIVLYIGGPIWQAGRTPPPRGARLPPKGNPYAT